MMRNITRTVLELPRRMSIAWCSANDTLTIVCKLGGITVFAILSTGLASAMLVWPSIGPATSFATVMFRLSSFAALIALSAVPVAITEAHNIITAETPGESRAYMIGGLMFAEVLWDFLVVSLF